MPKLILALTLAMGACFGAGPQRIVSTAPSITEMLFALGLGDRVVGVTSFCHYPAETAKLPKVGSFIRPNLEVIASLRPDLVIIQTNPVDLATKLKSLRLTALELDYEDVAGIYRSIETIADAAGVPERGRQLTAKLRKDLEDIRQRTAALPRRKMVFIVGRTPGTVEGLVAVGKASYLGELIQIAGGENVFHDSPIPYPRISLEAMLSRNPEVIVDMGDMAQTIGVTEEHKRGVVALWKRYPVLAAVRHGRVYPVASDIFVVPGPRMVEAAQAFAKMLHPEAGF